MTPISAAIFTLLTQNTAVANIVEDDVNPENIVQGNRTYPAIVYQVVSDQTDMTYSGPSGLQTSMVVIVCMSNSGEGGGYPQLQQMKTAVQGAIDGFPLAQGVSATVNGVLIRGAWMEQYHEGSFQNATLAENDRVPYGEFTFRFVFQNS